MKLLRNLIALCFVSIVAPASAWNVHGIAVVIGPRSEVSLNSLTWIGSEYEFMNYFKGAGAWGYGDNSGSLNPDELDANGYPLPGAAWTTHISAKTLVSAPAQAESPGDYVITWLGPKLWAVGSNNSNGQIRSAGCTGTAGTISNSGTCDNRACSTFTGSISGTTLTVTAAPTGTGCTLGAGIPISSGSIAISSMGISTIITSAGSVCGGNTCYTINQSQTVASSTMNMGGRFQIHNNTIANTTTNDTYVISVNSANSFSLSENVALVKLTDEAAYWASANPCGSGKGCIANPLFKTRIGQANFKVLRDLDLVQGNGSNCTTWASRRPVGYFSYITSELRNASSGPGQYVNASGTGASGGTVSYNAGTDTYSITLGAGGPVDKQTIIMLAPATGTASSLVSLNGNTSVPILAAYGQAIAFGNFIPQLNGVTTLVYDATVGGFLSFGGSTIGNRGLNCGVPPEIVVELNAELGTTPWHVPGVMMLDPMTDWITQYATYVKTNYPSVVPIFEATNEPWNSASGPLVCAYLSAKSLVYIGQDANHAWTSGAFCGSGGNTAQEVGKIASTMGQDLKTVYGAGNYELAIPVQTYFGGSSGFNGVLTSSAYVGQSMAAQSGYTQVAAYTVGTRVSVNNYWHTGYQAKTGMEIEAGLGYCYFNYSISTPCQGLYASQAAVMTAYMNSATTLTCGTTTCNDNNIARLTGFYLPQWQTFGTNCSQGSRPGNCTINAISPLMMYEGGFDPTNLGSDLSQSFTVASNTSPAILTVANNGCIAGQTVGLSGLSGGTWSTAAGSYTIQASGTDSGHCAINLDSTALGALTSATITYTGSQAYVNYLRALAYTAPEQDTLVSNLYASIVSVGGTNPSQYQLATAALLNGGNSWYVLAFDLFGYYPASKCTSCTISSTTLTLGGTITGIFRIGDTLFGGGVTGLGTGAGSNTTITSCTPIGGNVCGTAVGDTLGLSQASTVGAGTTMTGNATPPVNNAGNSTTSPVRAWGAICRWNGNGNQCNG